MATWWQRFKNIFNAKAHKALDAIENNIETLEQKVRELKTGHAKSVTGLAQVKALEIKYRSAVTDYRKKSDDYADKAARLKTRFDSAAEEEKEQLKSDIILMLTKKEAMLTEATQQEINAENQSKIVISLTGKIKEMTAMIKATESSIVNMKAQSEAAKVNKDISKELSNVNFDGVSSQIEEIKLKIAQDNAEADAWGQIDTALEGEEERIEKMLKQTTSSEDAKLFDDFMKA